MTTFYKNLVLSKNYKRCLQIYAKLQMPNYEFINDAYTTVETANLTCELYVSSFEKKWKKDIISRTWTVNSMHKILNCTLKKIALINVLTRWFIAWLFDYESSFTPPMIKQDYHSLLSFSPLRYKYWPIWFIFLICEILVKHNDYHLMHNDYHLPLW